MEIVRLDLSMSNRAYEIPVAVRSKDRSEAAVVLRPRVRIPLRAWIFVSCVCCASSGFCEELISHSEESYRVRLCGSNFVLSRNLKNKAV